VLLLSKMGKALLILCLLQSCQRLKQTSSQMTH